MHAAYIRPGGVHQVRAAVPCPGSLQSPSGLAGMCGVSPCPCVGDGPSGASPPVSPVPPAVCGLTSLCSRAGPAPGADGRHLRVCEEFLHADRRGGGGEVGREPGFCLKPGREGQSPTVPVSQHPEGWGLALPVPRARPAWGYLSCGDKVTRVRKGGAQSGRGSRRGGQVTNALLPADAHQQPHLEEPHGRHRRDNGRGGSQLRVQVGPVAPGDACGRPHHPAASSPREGSGLSPKSSALTAGVLRADRSRLGDRCHQ